MIMKPEAFYQPLIDEMKAEGDAVNALAMKKYMRNRYIFFGLKKDAREAITKAFDRRNGIPEIDALFEAVQYLWEQPQRELQYYAMTLPDKKIQSADRQLIELLEFMIVNKSWWDTVDYIAGRTAGKFFMKFPGEIKPRTQKWMDSGNFWLQRSALLFQLRYKQETDFDLLTEYIIRLKGSREFFIRKAIGWSLREYSKTAPGRVVDFVQKTDISNLSKTEALKWLKRKGAIK